MAHSTQQQVAADVEPPLSGSRLVVILGVGGSGKTEIALNLARAWAKALRRVHIVDFDLVTPYFRVQDRQEEMRRAGVEPIAPPESRSSIDVPFIPPQVPHVIADGSARAIFDVGGDEVGAITVRQFAAALRIARARTYVVVNARRPETASAEAMVRATRRLSAAAGLEVAGLIANTHLGEETTWHTCLEGFAITRDASASLGVPVVLLTYPEQLAASAVAPQNAPPMLPLHLHLALPWVG